MTRLPPIPQSDPTAQTTPIAIPLDAIVVRDASVHVRVGDNDHRPIGGGMLDVQQDVAGKLQIAVRVDDLIGGRFVADANLMVGTWQGQTHLAIHDLPIDSRHWIVSMLAGQKVEQVRGMVQADITTTHPPLDVAGGVQHWFQHHLTATATIDDLIADSLPGNATRIEAIAVSDNSGATIRIQGDPLGTAVDVRGRLDPLANPIAANLSATVAIPDVDALAKCFDVELASQASLRLNTNADVTMIENLATIVSSATTEIQSTLASGVIAAHCNARVQCDDLQDPSAHAAAVDVDVRDIRVAGQPLPPATAAAQWSGGKATAHASLRKLDLAAVAVVARRLTGQTIPVGGIVNFDLRSSASPLVLPIAWTVDADVHSDGLRYDNIAVESESHFHASEDDVAIRIQGSALDGSVNLVASGGTPELIAFAATSPLDPLAVPIDAEFTMQNVRFSKLVSAARLDPSLRDLRGRGDLKFVRQLADHDAGQIGRLTVHASDIGWQRSDMAKRVEIAAAIDRDRITVNSIDGRLAGGALSGRGEFTLSSPPRGHVRIDVRSAQLRRIAGPLGPSTASGFSGAGNFHLSAVLDGNVTGDALIATNHAVMGGVKVRSLRLPVDWSYGIANRTARWRLRAGTVEAGGGRIRLGCDGRFDRALTIHGDATLMDIDTSKLLVGGGPPAGHIDGIVRIDARGARNEKDLTGRFDLQLSHVDSMQWPVLEQLPTLMTIKPGIQSRANHGHVSGRISGGFVHLDSVEIVQSGITITAEGNASMDGRLNVDVIAATGSNSPTESLMSVANSPIMLAAPAPAKLLIRANEALRDRVVHVHVGGNAARPTLQIQPGRQLSQDAVRFLIASQFGNSVADLTKPQPKLSARR